MPPHGAAAPRARVHRREQLRGGPREAARDALTVIGAHAVAQHCEDDLRFFARTIAALLQATANAVEELLGGEVRLCFVGETSCGQAFEDR
jgi:hypothetical protein